MINIFIVILTSLNFLVYPFKNTDPGTFKGYISETCSKNVKVTYFEVGRVYLVKNCGGDNIRSLSKVAKIVTERTYKLPFYKIKSYLSEDTIPWYVKKIHLMERERLGLSGKRVICGIIDTGIDTTDTYLARSLYVFYDAVNDSVLPYDDNGHGTAVASLISGVYGVSPNTRLAVCKAFNANGYGTDEQILKCSQWLYDLKVKETINLSVINNSWGEDNAEYMLSTIEMWNGAGILSVFSAGNNGPFYRMIDAPSIYPVTFSIGATTYKDTLAWYSSRGPAPDTGFFDNAESWPVSDWNFTKPDFVAPGDLMYVTLRGGQHGLVSGTSFSAPVFSGILCLLKEAIPSITYKHAYELIKNNATCRLWWIRYPDSGYGFGRVDVGKLMDSFTPKIVYDRSDVKMEFPEGIEAIYTIYTMDGRLVKKGLWPFVSLENLNLRNGAYILILNTMGRKFSKGFVIIK